MKGMVFVERWGEGLDGCTDVEEIGKTRSGGEDDNG